MTGEHFVIVAYVVGAILLWGAAAWLWLAHRHLTRREHQQRG